MKFGPTAEKLPPLQSIIESMLLQTSRDVIICDELVIKSLFIVLTGLNIDVDETTGRYAILVFGVELNCPAINKFDNVNVLYIPIE